MTDTVPFAKIEGRRTMTLDTAEYRPYDLYDRVVEGIDWQPINFDRETKVGSFLVRLAPGTRAVPHVHTGGEDVLILDGEITDGDGRVFSSGDIISYGRGSSHSTMTKTGCTMLVFLHGPNEAIE